MTKPLTAAQKAANKKARAQRQDDARRDANVKANRTSAGPKELTRLLNAPFKKAKSAKSAKAAKKTKAVPPLTVARDGVVQNGDGSFSSVELAHDPAAGMQMQIVPTPPAGTPVSSIGADMAAENLRKLDRENRTEPLKGVRGRVTPKPAPAPSAARKRTARLSGTGGNNAHLEGAPVTKELKYADHGEGHPHRFSGRNWDGVLYRSANGTLGLERSKDEGATWERYLSDDEFVHRDRWDLGRAIQRSTKEKSHDIKGRRVAGASPARSATPRTRKTPAPAGEAAAPVTAVKIPRKKSTAAMEGEQPAPQVDVTRWQRAEVSTTCQWGHGDVMRGQTPCASTSVRRVVCCGGKQFVDVCDRHEKAFLYTKSSKWVGCISYPLTPTGPKLDGITFRNETPADEVVKI